MKIAPNTSLKVSWNQLMTDRLSMSHFETEIFPSWLPTCRWYSGKGEELSGIKLEKTIPFPCETTLSYLLIIKVSFVNGEEERYFIPLSFMVNELADRLKQVAQQALVCELADGENSGWVVDAIYDEDFRKRLFSSVRLAAKLDSGDIWLNFVRGTLLQEINEDKIILSRVFSAEQSNSSIIYNEQFFMKIFRKVHYGLNPDFEMVRFLSEQSSFRNIPVYLGSFSLHDSKGDALLGMMQPLVKNQGDAWKIALDYLEDYFLKHKIQLHKNSNNLKVDNLPDDLVNLVELLAHRTAQMHQSLSGTSLDGGFGIQTLSRGFAENWKDNVFALMDKLKLMLEGDRKTKVDKIIGTETLYTIAYLRDFVETNFSTLAGLPGIRNHGDYHLGQILIVDTDVCILDFEGEPGKSIEERRKHFPVWKDVAGMIRSFSYASFAAVLRNEKKPTPAMRDFAEKCSNELAALFLKTYVRNTTLSHVNSGSSSLVLSLFLVEKALYEIVYELNNREDWAIIPLSGLKQIVRQA